jgi:phage tail sheath gpL-like
MGQRFVPESFSELIITLVPADDMGVTGYNVPASFKISVSTSRMAAEWGNNYIINSRPFIFEILITAGESADSIATKLANAMATHESVFGSLPFTYAVNGAEVHLVAKESHLTISERVTVNFPFTDVPFILENANSYYIDS